MDYHKKYLKYKNKYLELKNNLKGGEVMFDFDRFFKSEESDKLYDDKLLETLTINKISSETLYNIKNDLQIFYQNLYENLTGTLKKRYIIMSIDNISRGNYKIGLGDELISQENVIIFK
jgi:hypothetical protein